MKKTPKKFSSRILNPVVAVIAALLAGGLGLVVSFEQDGTRFELHIGKSK